MLDRTYLFKKSGEVIFEADGPNQCGVITTSGLKVLKWNFALEAVVNSLDHRGFLFDQQDLDNLIEGAVVAHDSSSCELLGQTVLNEFIRWYPNQNVRLKPIWIGVRISPAPFRASMTSFVRLRGGGQRPWQGFSFD